MKRKLFFMLPVVAIIAIIFNPPAKSDSNGMNKHSGSPDEPTCSEPGCHGAGNGNGSSGGLADNAGPGSIALSCSNMPGNTYVPGTTYHMTITITQNGCQHFGFSGLALNSGMGNSGSFTATDATHTQVQTRDTRKYITHVAPPQGSYITTNPAVMNFDWVAPSANEGPVTFYYDGIAANNNLLNESGDDVYKGSVTFNPTNAVSAPLVLCSFTNQTLRATASLPSNPYRFYVSGLSLTGNVSVSVASPFEISTNPLTGFSTSAITLTQSSGSINTTPLYVRYNASLSGSTSASLSVSSTGATTKTITVTGQTANPVISTPSKTTIPQFTTTVGTPSKIDSFLYTFSGLMDSIVLTAPANFELSSNSTRDWSKKGQWVPFNPIWGLSNLKMYVRYNPLAAGSHSGNIVLSTKGGNTQNIAVSGVSSSTTGIINSTYDLNSLIIYQNPIRTNLVANVNLSTSATVAFVIYDMNGKLVKELPKMDLVKGDNVIDVNCTDLQRGIYFLSLKSKEVNMIKRILVTSE